LVAEKVSNKSISTGFSAETMFLNTKIASWSQKKCPKIVSQRVLRLRRRF
jgi:hypothetical protein